MESADVPQHNEITVVIKCGYCGRRELGRMLGSNNGLRRVSGPDAAMVGGELFRSGPEHHSNYVLNRFAGQRKEDGGLLNRLGGDRYRFRCHRNRRKCGGDIPARKDKLEACFLRAIRDGRDVVWLPNDL